MEFKYIVFNLVFFLGIPAGVLICNAVKPMRYVTLIAMIWATCEPDSVGINFLSREFYRSATRGIEISLVDICAWVLLFTMLMRPKEFKIRWFPPLTLLYALYIGVGIMGWLMAGPNFPIPPEAELLLVHYDTFEVTLYPVFEISKVIRGCLVYFVIVNFVRDERGIKAVLLGLTITALYMSYLTIADRYIHHFHRVKATLGHANSLSTYMAMMGTVMFAFTLQQRQLIRSVIYGVLTALCGVSVVLTISRGGLVALALGIWINFTSLFHRFFNIKNFLMIMIGAVGAIAVLGAAADTLAKRFFEEQEAGADLEYRGLYNAEAKMMAQDNIFGVGMGNFSAWSWNKYAEAVDPTLPPGTPAHNLWYLTMGELGVPGMILLMMIWARLYLLGLPFFFQRKKDLAHALAIASIAGTVACQFQSLLQLGYRQTPMYFMLKMFMGIVVAVWYMDREEKKRVTSDQ